MPTVYDQADLGSCSANALGAAFQFETRKQGLVDFMPSRLFIYYNERDLEGTIADDSGAMLRDGVKVLASLGACNEALWPYNVALFATKPAGEAYSDAAGHLLRRYLSVNQDLQSLKACLASGYPVAFGFQVYESFETEAVSTSGIAPMPNRNSEQCLGGHAVLLCGYSDATGMFLVRNSWGSAWGQSGNFWLPYSYLTDPSLASDFWTLRLVE